MVAAPAWEWRRGVALAVTAASGMASLSYQIVWTRQGSLWLGQESASVLAVVAAFFGGLALGAFCGGNAVARSARPLRWYVACEVTMALWAIVMLEAFEPVTNLLMAMTGDEPGAFRQWGVAFLGMLLLLLPSTTAMGLTLPAMERVLAAQRENVSSFGLLYAANCAGAIAGVVAAAFWAVPTLGMRSVIASCATVNAVCALAAALSLRPRRATGTRRADGAGQAAAQAAADASSQPSASLQPSVASPHPSAAAPRPFVAPRAAAAARDLKQQRRATLFRLGITGLLGIGYEVVMLRVLGQVTEQTVYTFAAALAVYLAGTTAGAAAHERWWAADDGSARTTDYLLSLLAIGCVLSIALLLPAERVRDGVMQGLGHGMAAAVWAEAALAALAFLLPTALMGALFSRLCSAARRQGTTLGMAVGVNGLGAAVAPAVLGVLAVPMLGPKMVVLLIALGYVVLSSRAAWRRPAAWLVTTAIAVMAGVGPSLAFVDVPDGGRLVSYIEGTTAAVSVVEDGEGVRRLRIDNREQEGSSSSYWFDARQAWLPLLLHASPQRALFLGLGTGVTAAAATLDPTLEVDVAELLPEVIASSAQFTDAFASSAATSRVRVIAADARRFVRASGKSYDVIVSDNFHPARSGAGALYTVEHFEAVRGRLAAGGVFCQWLPLHQLDLQSLRSIVGSFQVAFPDALALLASNSVATPVIGLIGASQSLAMDVETLRVRRSRVADGASLDALNLEDELAVLGSFVAGPEALRKFAASARINSDDLPVVAYAAPRITYAPDAPPRARLAEVLALWSISPADVLAPQSAQWAPRLAAYWSARDLYIETGSSVRPAAGLQQLLAQVREPLLRVVRTSGDFRPALMPLRQMASALAATDQAAAELLTQQIDAALEVAVPPVR